MKRYILLLFLASFALTAKESNQLQKVFLHTLEVDRAKEAHIELAKLVFYFSHEPQIRSEQVASANAKEAKLKFFFPGVSSSPEVMSMIDAVNVARAKDYRIQIEEVAKPSKGIELVISFNPEQIMIKHDTFDAITRAKGVEFHVYNKKLLKDLQSKGTSVLRTSYVQKPLIIIDAGHGGTDTGTISKNGLAEKNITLALSKKLEKELQSQGYHVCMTRAKDEFIALDQRTKIANGHKNALFISLHGNNASNNQVRGLETFCLDSHLFKSVNDELATAIDVIIHSVDEQKNKQSKNLAEMIHSEILAEFQSKKFQLPDRKVKYAATQVLMGINCPGILIEIDFLSHPDVEKNLLKDEYQDSYVRGICRGLKRYHA